MLTNAITPDRVGGLERYVRELSAQLVRDAWDVRVFTKRVSPSDPLQERASDGVQISRYPVPNKANPFFAVGRAVGPMRGVAREARMRPLRIVHGHFAVPCFYPAVVGAPYLYTFHAPVYKEILSERQGSYRLPSVLHRPAELSTRLVERLVVERASLVVVLSEFMRRELELLSARAADRALVVPGGIDTDFFSPGPASVNGDASASGPLIFTARRFTPRTGVLELVRAFSSILAQLPSARLAIAGTGAQQSSIEREIERRNLGQSVRLLGRVSDSDLVSWYRSADLVVMPTQELEGFGLTTAEALACGTPVVGTPAGATPELLTPIDKRLVARGTSPQAISDAVIAFFKTPDLVSIARSGARKRAEALSWTRVAQLHEAVYASPRLTR